MGGASNDRIFALKIWDAREGEKKGGGVQCSLTACRVPVAVACNAGLDVVVVDRGIEEGFDARFEAELMVIDLAPRLDEFGEANAEHVGWRFGVFAHAAAAAPADRAWSTHFAEEN